MRSTTFVPPRAAQRRASQLRQLLSLGLLALTPACTDHASTPARDSGPLTDARRDGPGSALVVRTSAGPVHGLARGAGRAFLGIPYAAPPVGPRRWAPPAAPPTWSETRDATALGPSCLQAALPSDQLPPRFSEDCLTLNVWTPHSTPGAPLPVMVWIHGGGFFAGGSASPLLDGQRLAEQGGLIVVSMNYRLGQLGFLAHPSLPVPGGNWGLLDQQAALRWVRDNIAAFGGDPERVTLIGESAGGTSVCMHVVAPSSRGLFQRIVVQSGPCVDAKGDPSYDLAPAHGQGAAFVAALGCADASEVLACLRSKPASEVLRALPTELATVVVPARHWGPVVDGSFLPQPPATALLSTELSGLRALIGSNGDEGTLMVLLASHWSLTAQTYAELVTQRVGDTAAPLVLARYSTDGGKPPRELFGAVVGDSAFVCATRRLARDLAAAGATVYGYAFTHAPVEAKPVALPLGAYHGAELPFLFNRPEFYGAFTEGERALAQQLIGYWTRFARDGAPGGDTPPWPPFDPGSDTILRLDLSSSTISGWKRSDCDFWDGLTR